jgi:ankyrin repeat protein
VTYQADRWPSGPPKDPGAADRRPRTSFKPHAGRGPPHTHKRETGPQWGSVEALRALHEAGADLDDEDGSGTTPLMLAAAHGRAAAVALILSLVPTAHEEEDDDGRTALIHAAKNGHADATRALLAPGGIDLDAEDDKERTALAWAERNGHGEVRDLLLAAGASRG